MGINQKDILVMFIILKLHGGRSIFLDNGMMVDRPGVNDVSEQKVIEHLSKDDINNFSIDDMKASIIRLKERGYLNKSEDRLCPSLALTHYYVEILQYGVNLEEDLKCLKTRMEYIEKHKS